MDVPVEAAGEDAVPRFTNSGNQVPAVSVIAGNNYEGKSGLLRAISQFSALAKTEIEPPQRKLLAQMVSSLFEDGPSENTVKAIDALTPQLDKPAMSAVDIGDAFRAKAHELADMQPDPEIRAVLLTFLATVEEQLGRP